MSIKLSVKIARARVVLFLTKKRYMGNYPKVKKAILVSFLLIVNSFVGAVLWGLVPTMQVKFVYENTIHAQANEKQEVVKAEEVKEETKELKTIEEKIIEAFKGDAFNALKVANCESRFHQDRIGDTHLVFAHEGELLGDSVGIFQIRTGGNEKGKVWKRAPEGMTTAEYREKLKDPDYNIAEAKKIYEKSGNTWGQWTCGQGI